MYIYLVNIIICLLNILLYVLNILLYYKLNILFEINIVYIMYKFRNKSIINVIPCKKSNLSFKSVEVKENVNK